MSNFLKSRETRLRFDAARQAEKRVPLTSFSVKRLRALATQLNIAGRSTMRKAQLVTAIEEFVIEGSA